MHEDKKGSLVVQTFVSVVFKLPLNSEYIYYCEGYKKPPLYARVLCDFSGRTQVGLIVGYPPQKNFSFEAKKILSIIDDNPFFRKEDYLLAKWIENYYFSSLGEALSLFISFSKVTISREKENKKKFLNKKKLELNQEQLFILNEITNSKDLFHLVWGVTGSGKTHLYLGVIEYYIKKNQQIILLLPEIALTPQMRGFFESYLPQEKIEIVHSKISSGKKLLIYKKFSNGELQILIGTRSLVFAPAKNLGAIIIDEEHESTYKNNSVPRYHARQIAQIKAQRIGAKLILGSATPSLELYYLALQKKIKLHVLKKRYSHVDLPKSELIFKNEVKKKDQRESYIIDERIYDHLKHLKEKKRQGIIYLNKRGYSSYIRCFDCNLLYKCPRCEIAYTYHREKSMLICHYCNSQQSFSNICLRCHSKNLDYLAAGTEKIIEELTMVMPNINFARVDSDILNTPNKIKKIFLEFKTKKIDILVGTQILSKGHDFSNLASVVILNPEIILTIPDFRSSEKAFNQITQVSGRAGRRMIRGEVYIQTAEDPHYSIIYGKEQNYLGFYDQEIIKRRNFLYPPFVKLFRLVIRSKVENIVIKKANECGFVIKGMGDMGSEILGPAPCVMSKINNYYRWNIIFKIKNYQSFKNKMTLVKKQLKTDSSYYIEYDMDPYNMY